MCNQCVELPRWLSADAENGVDIGRTEVRNVKGIGGRYQDKSRRIFHDKMGNLGISIHPDIGMSEYIEVYVDIGTATYQYVGYYNGETLEPAFDIIDRYERKEKHEALEQ